MTSTVNTPSDAVAAMRADWDLVRALLGGTAAMRKAGKAYLPQWPNEDDVSYAQRLETAVLFPGYSRTVATLTGKPFSKPLTLGDDVPEKLKGYGDNIDLEGRNLHTFAADVLESALGYGLGLILVDYPTRPDGVTTLAAERSLGLRPYFVQIKVGQILGWRVARVNGTWSLTQFRFMEQVEEPDGEFGTVMVDQVRVLEPGIWRTYRNTEKGWVLHAQGTTTLQYIPLAVAYGQRTGFMTGRPPLMEMAFLNVAHWQSASDQQTILHVARVPILAAIGVDENFAGITVGAKTAVSLPQDGDLKFVEHTGKAIEAGAKDLESLEERMRQAGAELLVIDNKLTATQVSAENAVGMCALQRIGESVEDAIDMALQMMADWVNEKQGGHVQLFKDYAASTLSDATTQMIKDWVATGLLSKEAAFSELQRRGAISADLVWEDVKDQMDMEGPPIGSMGSMGSMGDTGGIDVQTAKTNLDAAIALHERHMNGTAPTTGPEGEKSQQKMMDQMMAAAAALGKGEHA